MNRGRNSFSCLLLSLLVASPASAQTNTLCDELHGRFANITQVVGASAETRQLSRAIAQQNLMIRQLKSDMRNQGCASDSSVVIFGSGSGDSGACDEMQTSLDRMQQDLGSLMDERELSLTRVDAEGAQRRQLLATMQRNGCNAPASAEPDTVINTRLKQEPYTPEEQSLAQPESSVTSIETRKPQPDATLPQRQMPTTSAPAVTQIQPRQMPADRPYDPSANKVRQVGPQFLATDQGGIDLKHPKAAGPQPAQ
ncbi:MULTISPECIES: hypothetical protein [Rhizobium]|uniref:Uncharacterized protein n=1 Tax=Rhizobium paranaense TaxID=1650438 RepID=A0A7W8XQF9_9HYPH|nr:hypothetical protein [Rhizobium sp. SEMIA4064]MBB5573661.1 hypothetical protein [Rhizobium paranaense]PST63032.1 hypothetical protein C9E91_10630 [Rhizobium sp. SEMIA4064]